MAINNKQLELLQIYRQAILAACLTRKLTVSEMVLTLEDMIVVHRSTLNTHLNDMVARQWVTRTARRLERVVSGPRPYEYATTKAGEIQLNRMRAKEKAHACAV